MKIFAPLPHSLAWKGSGQDARATVARAFCPEPLSFSPSVFSVTSPVTPAYLHYSLS